MEAVIFCGIQGSGKSTFFRQRFFDTHVRLNQDCLRTRTREALLLGACIEGKTKFVVDNTNPTALDRAPYITAARVAGFRVIGFYFAAKPSEALERNSFRQGSAQIPVAGLLGTYKRLQIPRMDEGFDELYYVRNSGDGTFVVEPWGEDAGCPREQSGGTAK